MTFIFLTIIIIAIVVFIKKDTTRAQKRKDEEAARCKQMEEERKEKESIKTVKHNEIVREHDEKLKKLYPYPKNITNNTVYDNLNVWDIYDPILFKRFQYGENIDSYIPPDSITIYLYIRYLGINCDWSDVIDKFANILKQHNPDKSLTEINEYINKIYVLDV